ncbi:hypothetical protein SNEBB_007079 [Seison nebaliae]|nr:hypothetical protein SNEBB_007079 [Seison nebaliae]
MLNRRQFAYEGIPNVEEEDNQNYFSSSSQSSTVSDRSSDARKYLKKKRFLLRNSLRRMSVSLQRRHKQHSPMGETVREIIIGKTEYEGRSYPRNVIDNQKYSVFTFIPKLLYHQFKFFLNFYFLVMALTQFIEVIRVNYWYTYWGPLGFVLTVSAIREAFDDIKRWRRDSMINRTKYNVLHNSSYHFIGGRTPNEESDEINWQYKKASQLKVGDVIRIEKEQRVPADCILLKILPDTSPNDPIISTVSSTENGNDPSSSSSTILSCYVRTDQLDGETDWKVRLPINHLQSSIGLSMIVDSRNILRIQKPHQDIHSFEGVYERIIIDMNDEFEHLDFSNDQQHQQQQSSNIIRQPLTIDNTVWSGTVVANCSIIAVIIYTGKETRVELNSNQPRNKVAKIDKLINFLTKILFMAVIILALILIFLRGFFGKWYEHFIRYILLFSYIIPISLRVNLDVAKVVHSWFISHDKDLLPNAAVRTSTISEDLGIISYVLTDKTGTLTCNEMKLKKIHLGSIYFTNDSIDDIREHLINYLTQQSQSNLDNSILRQSLVDRVYHSILSIALCNNVTPSSSLSSSSGITNTDIDLDQLTYEASSPDEIALVEWAAKLGVVMIQRSLTTISIKINFPQNDNWIKFRILRIFPFKSETKRMGVILQEVHPNQELGQIIFMMKGADHVMQDIVQSSDWLNEETSNLAREELRTLVFGRRILTKHEYDDFSHEYERLMNSVTVSGDRPQQIQRLIERVLENNLELLCCTGIEDRLQENVRQTLETLRHADVIVWMLTGDKMETARCIARSSRLVHQSAKIYQMKELSLTSSMNELMREIISFRSLCLNDDDQYHHISSSDGGEQFKSVNNYQFKNINNNNNNNINNNNNNNNNNINNNNEHVRLNTQTKEGVLSLLYNPTMMNTNNDSTNQFNSKIDNFDLRTFNRNQDGRRTMNDTRNIHDIGGTQLNSVALAISGTTLETMLQRCPFDFARLILQCPTAVVVARCAPTQKALAAEFLTNLKDYSLSSLTIFQQQQQQQQEPQQQQQQQQQQYFQQDIPASSNTRLVIDVQQQNNELERQGTKVNPSFQNRNEIIWRRLWFNIMNSSLFSSCPMSFHLCCCVRCLLWKRCCKGKKQQQHKLRQYSSYQNQSAQSTNVDELIQIDKRKSSQYLDGGEEMIMNKGRDRSIDTPSIDAPSISPYNEITNMIMLSEHRSRLDGTVAAIGDGGNDVSMIQAANIGIGLVGKEGEQASLAADFSLIQFSHIIPLMLIHGRHSYKRTASLSQFVMHRGLILTTIQIIFSLLNHYTSKSLYPGLLLIGYATLYTMFPVFSLVLDRDITSQIALNYPLFYKQINQERPLSIKTFLIWVIISTIQGFGIMYGGWQLLKYDKVDHVMFDTANNNEIGETTKNQLISLTFSALILTELLMVALTIRTWHIPLMPLSSFLSLSFYLATIIFYHQYFDHSFILSGAFAWKVTVLVILTLIPMFILVVIRKRFTSPAIAKLMKISTYY